MAENNIESMLIGLVNAGIKKVRVYYEGGGDSGCIDSIKITTDPDMTFDDLEDWDTGTQLDDYNAELYTLVNDFCTDQLLNDIEDWWNDHGGWGTIHIDVEAGTYSIQNNVTIVHEEEYIHKGHLFYKNTK
jgi:hypothetical protein